MGPLRLFTKRNHQNPGQVAEGHEIIPTSHSAGILTNLPVHDEKGLDAVYAFFLNDYESIGYNDALINPDETYKSDNIRLLNHELFILIERTSTYYEDLAKEVEFHISTRSRAGLVDLVEELKIRMQIINDHRGKLTAIKKEALEGTGHIQCIGLSYQRGFMRGLSSISQAKVLNNR
jgi:cold shock CspA family protein